MAIEFDNQDKVLVRSLQYVYPKLYNRIVSLSEITIYNEVSVDHCFKWSTTFEKHTFWSLVNEGLFDAAMLLQPHLFEQGLTSDVVTLNDIKF